MVSIQRILKTCLWKECFPTDDTFRIVYTGTIYTGKRDPAPLFKAVGSLLQNKLNPEGLRIIFCGSNSDVSDIARKYSVNNIVEYAGFLPREVALRMQRDADALLFLEYESENVQGILTGNYLNTYLRDRRSLVLASAIIHRWGNYLKGLEGAYA
jgi:glycosyltransferase involved in cell wall biosynthesis